MVHFLFCSIDGKCSQQAELSGENINITYKPDGTHIAVGNRVCSRVNFVHCKANFYLLLVECTSQEVYKLYPLEMLTISVLTVFSHHFAG